LAKKNIVICDLEKDYGKKLLEAFNEKAQKDIKFTLFHDLSLFEQFINKESPCCLVLDSEIPVEARAKMKISTKIILARCGDITLGEDEIKVRKYQHVDDIYKGILKKAYQLEVDKVEKGRPHKNKEHKDNRGIKKECKIIGVYSPIHRIGKTKFAIELGKELGAEGPVLYLNMEPFAPGSYFKVKSKDNLEKLIYSAGQGHKNLGLSASMMASQLGEMDYIEPMAIANDLFNVKGTMWMEIIDRIINESIYETIILDLSDGINDLFSILEYCHVVYTLYIEEPVALSKLKQYTDNLLRTGYESVLEHTIQKKVEVM